MDFLLVEIAIGTTIILAVTGLAFAFIAWISQAERADRLVDMPLATTAFHVAPHPDTTPTLHVPAPPVATTAEATLPADEPVDERELVLA
ncbi:MAG: hypothetical protein AAF809_09060 [Bacteroidota bacterium]